MVKNRLNDCVRGFRLNVDRAILGMRDFIDELVIFLLHRLIQAYRSMYSCSMVWICQCNCLVPYQNTPLQPVNRFVITVYSEATGHSGLRTL